MKYDMRWTIWSKRMVADVMDFWSGRLVLSFLTLWHKTVLNGARIRTFVGILISWEFNSIQFVWWIVCRRLRQFRDCGHMFRVARELKASGWDRFYFIWRYYKWLYVSNFYCPFVRRINVGRKISFLCEL